MHRQPVHLKHLEQETPYEQVFEEIHQASTEESEQLNPLFAAYCEEIETHLS